MVDCVWNVMAHGDAREGKWMGNWRMEWVASTLHTTSEIGVFSITTADAHTSVARSRLNWRPCRFKWTRPFRRKTKSGFCACAITFQTQSTMRPVFRRTMGTTENCTQWTNFTVPTIQTQSSYTKWNLLTTGKEISSCAFLLRAGFTVLYHDTDKKNSYPRRRTGASDCTQMCRSEKKRFSYTFGDYTIRILGKWPTWRTILYYVFISILYMFRATPCLSSEE
jgi:hypothetical protein